jgi:hypothetical protein
VHYKLHIICGVNPKVPKGSSAGLAMRKFKFEYFHINFLATAKGPNSALTAPQLFFAECSYSDKEKLMRPSWCTPVQYSCIDNGMLSGLYPHGHTVISWAVSFSLCVAVGSHIAFSFSIEVHIATSTPIMSSELNSALWLLRVVFVCGACLQVGKTRLSW